MIDINVHSKVDLPNLYALSRQTEIALSKYIFSGNGLEGGCAEMQTFAKRVNTLQALQNQVKSGEYKDRAIAVAQCIGAAFLVAAAADFYFLTFSAVPYNLVSALTIWVTTDLFADTCKNVFSVFNRPWIELLNTELSGMENVEFLQKTLQQIGNVLNGLEDQLALCNKPLEEAQKKGAETSAAELRAKQDEIRAAYSELLNCYLR